MSPYKIEHNVPVPAAAAAGEYPFEQMKPGDSFIAGSGPKLQRKAVQVRVLTAAKAFCRNGHATWKFTSRSVRGGLRVWRVK